MKILFTADPFIPVPPVLYGGIERIIASLATRMRARGHTVGLLAHPDSELTVDCRVGWPQSAPSSATDHLQNTLRLRSAVASFRPDLVHSFARLAYLAPALLSRLPKVMSFQRLPSRRTVHAAALLGRRSLTFTGCSEYIAAEGRIGGGTWHAIPNFVDTEQLTFASDVASDGPLVFLSRIEQIKGTHVAIEIARRSGRRLLIAGNH